MKRWLPPLEGYCPPGGKESDNTEQLTTAQRYRVNLSIIFFTRALVSFLLKVYFKKLVFHSLEKWSWGHYKPVVKKITFSWHFSDKLAFPLARKVQQACHWFFFLSFFFFRREFQFNCLGNYIVTVVRQSLFPQGL